MASWFEQNAEKAKQLRTAPPPPGQAVVVDVSPAIQGGDWFKKNAPLLNRPGEPVTPHPQQGLPDITNEDLGKAGRFGLDLLPAAGGFAGDMIPGPLGVAASGALGGVGEGIRQGVLAATGAEGAPRSIPEAMKNIGVETAVQAGTSAIGSGVSKVLGKVFKRWIDPAELYQSALGPVPSTGKKAIDEMVATGLKERIPVSAEGLHRAESLINDIHKEVEAMIATKAGAPINPRDVVKRLDAVRARWSQTPENLKAIDDIELKFLEQYKTQGSLTAASAQEKKKQLYKQIRQGSSNAYAENRVAPPEIDLESQKELARGLKEEIIDMHPVLKGKGIREGDLIPLERALDRWASRQSNHKMLNVFGLIGTAMGGVVGGGAGGPEGAAIGAVAPAAAWLVKSVMDSPEVKSGLAIAMKRAGRYVPENTTKVINLPNAIRAAREGVFGHPVEKKEP